MVIHTRPESHVPRSTKPLTKRAPSTQAPKKNNKTVHRDSADKVPELVQQTEQQQDRTQKITHLSKDMKDPSDGIELGGVKQLNPETNEAVHRDYTHNIREFIKQVAALHDLLDESESSRSHAMISRKYPKLFDAMAVPLMIGVTFAAGNPLVLAIAFFGLFDSQTSDDVGKIFAKLFKFLEYREKNTLSGSLGFYPRFWEYLTKFPSNHRYQRGLYDALHKGLHSQEHPYEPTGTWREALLPKRISLDNLLKRAEVFYSANSIAIDDALKYKLESPVMDEFINHYLHPVNHELGLIQTSYLAKVRSGINSYQNKFKGAIVQSRRLEDETLDKGFRAQFDTSSQLRPIIRVIDAAAEINPFVKRSNYAYGVAGRATNLGNSLEQNI